MFKDFGLIEESNLIDYSVRESIKNRKLTKDLSNKNYVGTNELGDWIVQKIFDV
jgi:isocitrate dehydrogenase